MDIYQHQPWRSYRPLEGQSAGVFEMDPDIRHIPVSSHQSINSTTGVSDTSYIGLINGSQPNDIQREPPGYQGIFRWWLPEILSSCFSVASLIALIVVLRTYNRRGLNDLNLPSWLTLNGLVAVIATLNRVALVAPVEAAMSQEVWLWFSASKQQSQVRSRLEDLEISDSASRGAWGSFVFLWKGGGRWLSYIGAVVVILSLGFGAFTQQLISIVNLPISDTSLNDLSPGNAPHTETWNDFTGNPAEGGLATTLRMKAGVYNGMLEGGIAPVQASCPTGNCTFPITPTLAVCGECKTVPYKTSCNLTICHYTLSTGTIVEFPNWFSDENDSGLKLQVVSRDFNIIGTRRLDLVTFDVFGAPYDSFGGQWSNSSTISSTCSLWMCVNGLAIETKASIQTQYVNYTFSETAHAISDTDFNGGLFINFSSLPTEMNPLPGAEYSVGSFAYIGLTEFLPPLATGNVSVYPESHIPTSDTVEAIWNGTVDGLDGWVKNLALSMTNVIRTSAATTDARYNGIAYQSGIQVRWYWLVLPVAMVLMSLFVLIVVMIETSKARVKAWKGSPLAYLMTDVDGAIKQDVGGADVAAFKGVEKAVGRRRVVLDSQLSGRLILREAGL